MPVGATRFNSVLDQYEVWDNVNNAWVPATSTPDVSGTDFTPAQVSALESIAPGITTLIKQAQNPNERWTDTFAKIATNLGLGVQQYQLMALNVQRAREGKPPIDVASYAGAGVNIGLSAGTQQLVTYAGLALVGIVLLNMATRK
jgi:hypothetical protein